jgi:hypothetical protein
MRASPEWEGPLFEQLDCHPDRRDPYGGAGQETAISGTRSRVRIHLPGCGWSRDNRCYYWPLRAASVRGRSMTTRRAWLKALALGQIVTLTPTEIRMGKGRSR